MDEDDRRIGMLIAAFDDERQHLQRAIDALNQTGKQLQQDVRSAAKGAVETALKDLNSPIKKAAEALIDIQRLSLWRAAWQHALVALVAMAIALLAVWWYVPPLSEITARRAELDQLQASIEDLSKRGARMKFISCGPAKRLCVLVDRTAGQFGVDGNKDDMYMIPKGY
jgi:hypothetical protein